MLNPEYSELYNAIHKQITIDADGDEINCVVLREAFWRITKDIYRAIWLGQLWYWTPRATSCDNGQVYKTAQEWERETHLTTAEQRRVRKWLVSEGFITELYARQQHRMYYQINLKAISNAISACGAPTSQKGNATLQKDNATLQKDNATLQKDNRYNRDFSKDLSKEDNKEEEAEKTAFGGRTGSSDFASDADSKKPVRNKNAIGKRKPVPTTLQGENTMNKPQSQTRPHTTETVIVTATGTGTVPIVSPTGQTPLPKHKASVFKNTAPVLEKWELARELEELDKRKDLEYAKAFKEQAELEHRKALEDAKAFEDRQLANPDIYYQSAD